MVHIIITAGYVMCVSSFYYHRVRVCTRLILHLLLLLLPLLY
jgi:hypothetical protein